MTYDPKAIAREGAQAAWNIKFPISKADWMNQCEAIILSTAARMVRDSGAVEALDKAEVALNSDKFTSEPQKDSASRCSIALQNLRTLQYYK